MTLTIQQMDDAAADLEFIKTYRDSTADSETSRLGANVDTPIGRIKKGGYTEITVDGEWAAGVFVDNYNGFMRYNGETYVVRFGANLPITTGSEPDLAVWEVAAADQLISRYNDLHLSGYAAINFQTIADMQALTAPTLQEMSVNVGDMLTIPLDPNNDHRKSMAFRVDSVPSGESYPLANGLHANRVEYADEPVPPAFMDSVEFTGYTQSFDTIHGAVLDDNHLIVMRHPKTISIVDGDLNRATVVDYPGAPFYAEHQNNPALVAPGILLTCSIVDSSPGLYFAEIISAAIDLRGATVANFTSLMDGSNVNLHTTSPESGYDSIDPMKMMNLQLTPIRPSIGAFYDDASQAITFYRNLTRGTIVALSCSVSYSSGGDYVSPGAVQSSKPDPQAFGYTSQTISQNLNTYLVPRDGGRFVRYDLNGDSFHIISSADPVEGSPIMNDEEVYLRPVTGKDGNLYLFPKHANQPDDTRIGRLDVTLNAFDPNWMVIPKIFEDQEDYGPSFMSAIMATDGWVYCVRLGTLGPNYIRINLETQEVQEVDTGEIDVSTYGGAFMLNDSRILMTGPNGLAYINLGENDLNWPKSAYITNR